MRTSVCHTSLEADWGTLQRRAYAPDISAHVNVLSLHKQQVLQVKNPSTTIHVSSYCCTWGKLLPRANAPHISAYVCPPSAEWEDWMSGLWALAPVAPALPSPQPKTIITILPLHLYYHPQKKISCNSGELQESPRKKCDSAQPASKKFPPCYRVCGCSPNWKRVHSWAHKKKKAPCDPAGLPNCKFVVFLEFKFFQTKVSVLFSWKFSWNYSRKERILEYLVPGGPLGTLQGIIRHQATHQTFFLQDQSMPWFCHLYVYEQKSAEFFLKAAFLSSVLLQNESN
jgi:hypothetical protein